MKKFPITVITIFLLVAIWLPAGAATLNNDVNNGTVLYLLNNQKDNIQFTVTGYMLDRAGSPEYYDIAGSISSGSCIGILSKNKNIVGDCLSGDNSSKKTHLEIHFYTDKDKTGYRLYLDGVNSRKSKQFGTLLNAVEQDNLYPFNNAWVWNTNNKQHNIDFGPAQMTRTLKYSSLTPQLSLDNVIASAGNAALDGRSPIGIVNFPLQMQIIGSITCYYYNADGSVSIIDNSAFFDNICKTKGQYITNTGKEMIIQ